MKLPFRMHRRSVWIACAAVVAALFGTCVLRWCLHDPNAVLPAPAGGEGGERAAVATVNVDNGTGLPVRVRIDGRDRGALEPQEILRITDLPVGLCTFVITSEGRTIDRIDTEIRPGELTVVNPQGASVYLLLTPRPAVARGMDGPQGPVERRIAGERLIRVPQCRDLFEPAPAFSDDTPAGSGRFQAKIFKIAPETILLPHARSITRHPFAYPARDVTRAAEALCAAPPGPETHAVLMTSLTSGSPQLVRAVFAGLGAHADGIETKTLVGWLSATGPTRTPAARGARMDGAVKLLMARGQAAAMVPVFYASDPGHRRRLLSACIGAESAASEHRIIVQAALARWHPSMDGALRAYVCGNAFMLDGETARRVQDYLDGLDDTGPKAEWRRRWPRKVCAAAMHDDASWAVPYLREYAADGDEQLQQLALGALMQMDGARYLPSAFAGLKPRLKVRAIDHLSAAAAGSGTVSDAAVGVVVLALGDADGRVRKAVVDYLTAYVLGKAEVLGRVSAAVDRVQDPAQRAKARSALDETIRYRLIGRAGQQEVARLVTAGGSETVVREAMIRVTQGQQSLREMIERIETLYRSIQAPQNRQWFLSALEVHDGRAFRDMRRRLYRKALGDVQESVWATALLEILEMDEDMEDDRERYGRMIRRIQDKTLRRKVLGVYHRRYAELCLAWREDPKTRALADKTLARLAASHDTGVVYTMLTKWSESVRATGDDQALLTDAWLQLYPRLRTREQKAEALGSVKFTSDTVAAAFCRRAGRDPDVRTRRRVFDLAWDLYRKSRSAVHLLVLKDLVAAETDAATKADMQQTLAGTGEAP